MTATAAGGLACLLEISSATLGGLIVGCLATIGVGLTVSTWQGVVVVIAVLAVAAILVLADRRHRYRRVRFGVFLERERYENENDAE